MSRTACIERATSESSVVVEINLDGMGQTDISTTVPFYDHMLTALGRHSLIDLTVRATGDTEIDVHHTVEDTAICIGEALRVALWDKRGIRRFGEASVPLDEALAHAVVDISGRPYLVHEGESEAFVHHLIGGHFTGSMVRHVLEAIAYHAGICLHVRVLSGRDPHHIAEAEFKAAGVPVTAFQGNVSRRDDQFRLVKHAVDTFGQVDVFVNNAGVEDVMPLDRVTEADFDRVFNINVKGVLWGIQAAGEQMKKQGGDRIYKIINAASIAAHESYDLLGIYCASKFSVRALTVAAAKELAPHRITVNAYCPGVAGTRMWDRIDEEMGKIHGWAPGEAFKRFSSGILMGRPQEPHDVASLVHYLASPDSDYMTGQAILIDGGMVFR